jgi:hypothetical protein
MVMRAPPKLGAVPLRRVDRDVKPHGPPGTSVLNLPRFPQRKRVSALSRGAQRTHPWQPVHPDPGDRGIKRRDVSQGPEALIPHASGPGSPLARPAVFA